MTAIGCVTGRFQPVHDQHLDLFTLALASCEHLIIAITNPDAASRRPEDLAAHRHTDAANPFTYYERARLLDAASRARGFDGRVTMVPFDLTQPDQWVHYVPLAARQFVRAYGEWEREKATRLTQAGYIVTLIQGDPTDRRSAADIRTSLTNGDARWRTLAPAGTENLLERFTRAAASR